MNLSEPIVIAVSLFAVGMGAFGLASPAAMAHDEALFRPTAWRGQERTVMVVVQHS
jgi:hypothetical protein